MNPLDWLLRQARRPRGWAGRLLVRGMNRAHGQMTDWALSQLSAHDSRALLDIGCGASTAPKNKALAKAEAAARKVKRGVWADPNPIPPWEWRQKQREKEKQARSDVDTGFWLNTTTGSRHNSSCPNYRNTKRGRPCGPGEGRACGMCGG